MEQDEDQDRLERQIDDNLRRVFAKTLDDDVPDRFVALLNRLREQEAVLQ